jgi:hypothetical protein
MDEWSNLEQAIEQLAASGAVEVHEEGEWLAGLDGFRSEVRRKSKQALIHLWSSESNLVRAAAFEGILSFGLLWLDWTRQRTERRAIEGLRLFLPERQCRVTLERTHCARAWGWRSTNSASEIGAFG